MDPLGSFGENWRMSQALEGGRRAFEKQAWGSAYTGLLAADRESSLGPQDLDRLAVAAYLTGNDVECGEPWARAFNEYQRVGDAARAARSAFWLALGLMLQGEMARGGGWLMRAQRLLDDAGTDCAEQGLLLLPLALGNLGQGDGPLVPTDLDALTPAHRSAITVELFAWVPDRPRRRGSVVVGVELFEDQLPSGISVMYFVDEQVPT